MSLMFSLLVAITPSAAPALPAPCGYSIEWHPEWSPSARAGCVLYGEGDASQWPGPGVARNDCVWPWTNCTPIRVTSLETGRSVVVTPTMFCDCYVVPPGPNGEDTRLVDLDPATLRQLGLDPSSPRLYDVRVEPAVGAGTLQSSALPDTALQ